MPSPIPTAPFPIPPCELRIKEDGAQLFREVLGQDALKDLKAKLAHLPKDQPGTRLRGIDELTPILEAEGSIGTIAAGILGSRCKPVRAIYFNKTPLSNWSLGWHQDRTVAVRERRDVPGFGPWTVKSGWHHVAPPAEILSGMLTLRVHIDRVDPDNSPLLIAPGSHRLGRISESEIAEVVERFGAATCIASGGDVWAYSTPILHASNPAEKPGRRRVLQLDYAAQELPDGLEWLGL